MSKKKRLTIGFISANIHTGASRALWPGILDAAENEDVNLISFPGGRLNAPENYENMRNKVFDLIDPNVIDGIVSWTSALAGVDTVTSEEVIEFHNRYQPIPKVSLASPVGNSPLVSIDSYFGMQSLVLHLVDVHHYEKIALIRGPEGHPYASERYHAFRDILREKGLPFNPGLISPMVNWEEGAEAMETLLDQRMLIPGEDFQAVVATSDLLAVGAVRVLIDRGIRVPGDVAVVGFNDSEEGRLVRPPLTSVSLPFYQQGQRAAETLVRSLRGESVPGKVVLESKLLVRQSCGCASRSIGQAATEITAFQPGLQNRIPPSAQNKLAEQIIKVISNPSLAATWAKILLDAFYTEVVGAQPSQFLSVLDGMLKQGQLDGDETAAWQSTISMMRNNLLGLFSPEQQAHAENLYGQARILISEAIQHTQTIRQVEQRRQNRLLRDFGQELITSYDLEKLTEVLTARLPDLLINSFYLALYDHPDQPGRTASLVLAIVDGNRVSCEEGCSEFPAAKLVPPHLLPPRRFSFVIEPLFFHQEQIGYAVFEVGPRDGDVYEVLRGHISSALKGALLFEEVNHARQSAEHANQIKTRLLANVSHELRTPLNIILGNTQRIQDTKRVTTKEDFDLIHHNAEHLLRLINDLLDMSRAEINSLDLYPERLDPIPLLEEAFAAFANNPDDSTVTWHLDLPETLPAIDADPLRLRQVLLNLLSNAEKFTPKGEVRLGAASEPTNLHLWVSDTGPGISPEIIDKIYEPFFTHRTKQDRRSGIGLGLSITRHLVNLHNGHIKVHSSDAAGTTFHIYLPLPERSPVDAAAVQSSKPLLWLVSSSAAVPEEVQQFSNQQGLETKILNPGFEIQSSLSQGIPTVIAWNLSKESSPEEWILVRRLQNHPDLLNIPFILFQKDRNGGHESGVTSLVVKPASNQELRQSIQHAFPKEPTGRILIIDDDPKARNACLKIVREGLPGYEVLTAEDGIKGLDLIRSHLPGLVILDLMMPNMDGFDVLDAMRADETTRSIPVVILSARQLSFEDIQRMERHSDVILHRKEVLTDDEILAAFNRSLFGEEKLPAHTSQLVKLSIAYIHQHYAESISRMQIATAIGVSEDYLTRLFKQELGISPWDYLNRYRIIEAQRLLRETNYSIGTIGKKVGISDASYFNRVFRRITGYSPGSFREETGL